MSNEHEYSIVPPTGAAGDNWFQQYVLQQGKQGSLSSAGWTVGAEGFSQQTFLGASIRSFTINGGFGDTSSTMSCELVDDEYNKSDGIGFGDGDDAYHNGENDLFRPPAVGSPVWFKFGKNFANVEQAWRLTFDQMYGYNTLNPVPFETSQVPVDQVNLDGHKYVDLSTSTDEVYTVVDKSPLWDNTTEWRGKDHIVFGGILQGYTSNSSPTGGVNLYTVNVTDPREILSNCVILLNNYQGTTFNNKNLFNVYGFLEYDPSQSLQDYLLSKGTPNILQKEVYPDGSIEYVGNDTISFPSLGLTSTVPAPGTTGLLPAFWPVTGQGFSRRSDQGVPFYRISQALAAMFEYYGLMPQEYVNAGFGGRINFRGFNYVVDFSGLPVDLIPPMYFMDFDQMDLLSFAQEVCDIISHELFVQLLPVIDHPACEFLEEQNKIAAQAGRFSDIISGIIRIDAIDKSQQPRYGAILEYLNDLEDSGIEVLNQDVGFELSNVVTDKFVVGAQEVEMYFFHTNNDRDELQVNIGSQGQTAVDTLRADQWLMETSLKQQVLPYYGLLGNKAVTIPRGWGSYQQILLDATSLNAFGVGNYYIATELELRAALVSYDRWKNFLLKYNETYIQDVSEYGATFAALSNAGAELDEALKPLKEALLSGGFDSESKLSEAYLAQFENKTFAVSVPRSVWDSDKPYMGYDGLPASPCSPPFGYPLYYKRATKIGIPEAGVVKILNAKTRAVTNLEKVNDRLDSLAEASYTPVESAMEKYNFLAEKLVLAEKNYRETLTKADADEAIAKDENIKKLRAAVQEAKELAESQVDLQKRLERQGKRIVAKTLNTIDGIAENPMISNLPQIAKSHLDNAKKVYNFVKQVAEQNLGKKFLVKVPKACNVNYQPKVKVYGSRGANIKAGPFGFAPVPVDDNYQNPQFLNEIAAAQADVSSSEWFLHYTNVDILKADGSEASLAAKTNVDNPYRNGALRCNYNPINDIWNYNYKPEPQGGYFNYSVFQNPNRNDAVQEMLCPNDIKNFIGPKGRVQCYAKYDNSHMLNFAGVPASEMSQQSLDSGNNLWVPDIVQSLPNVRADQLSLFRYENEEESLDDNAKNLKQPPSVAFVKCSVEEKLFMPPKMTQRSVDIYGRKYEAYLSNLDFDLEEKVGADGCPEYELKINNLDPVFALPEDGGLDGTKAPYIGFLRDEFRIINDPSKREYIVNTETQNLDPNHVYALVTVPGRIQATMDQRYADGPMQQDVTVSMKQIMTQDVVKIPEFSVPAFAEKVAKTVNCDDIDFNPSLAELNEIQALQRQVAKGVKFNQGEAALQFIQPSPIYPSMIALPLMSWERCYGPWLSSADLDETRLRYNNLGGKIEFLKDENLAPWNYGGYQLLNEAGILQAQFSNSLMMINERGGFVVPEIPTGISLAGALKQSGPLVTSISANVTDNSIQTTVKLDLYTASYGKLQKQKEGAISQITRERQKLKDQNNNAIRRGLGKSQTAIDPVAQLLENGGQKLIDLTKQQDAFFTAEETQPKLMIASDSRTRVGPQSLISKGVEAYNTVAQKAQAFGAKLPTVSMDDVFSVVSTAFGDRSVPSVENYNQVNKESTQQRYDGNPNDGDTD